MKVLDILENKGDILYTVKAEDKLNLAIEIMAEKNIGSVVVIDKSQVIGILTFREIIKILKNFDSNILIKNIMKTDFIHCHSDIDIEEVCKLMLNNHIRYLPIINNNVLMGVISLYDVTKTVFEGKEFENNLLKKYIKKCQ